MAGNLRIRVGFKYASGTDVIFEKDWEYEVEFNDSLTSGLDLPAIERWLVPTAGDWLHTQIPGGIIVAENQDATNFVEIRANSSEDPVIRLIPGDICIFRLDDDASGDQIKADTGATAVKMWMWPKPE